ncbi:MAG TPA: MmcQ/YjbR family DNA-binding protein [Actinocrinis sp.]|nr:MmcQ/YjbR family DNA-binding protein [Actinocrinis sp.]
MTDRSDRAEAPEKVRARLLRLALGFPGAWQDHPWGETVVKVDKKVFVFLGMDEAGENGPRFGVKLTAAHAGALGVDGITRMGYGLGKAGWVDVRIARADVPVEVFEDWVEESYRAVALKRRVAELDGRTQAG